MKVTVTLTQRQVTLVLVALLNRMTALKDREDMKASYEESRDTYKLIYNARKDVTHAIP